MAHRRRRSLAQKEAERRRLEERKLARKIRRAYEGHPKSFAAGGLLSVLVVVVAALAFTSVPAFDYEQCFQSQSVVRHVDFQMFIQVGERAGQLNISFIRIPEFVGWGQSCKWPFVTKANTPDERGDYYTKVHNEAPYNYPYTVAGFFESWGEWKKYPSGIYFEDDGVSFYRSQRMEFLLHRGWADPHNDSYETTVSIARSFVPMPGDYIHIIVHTPYTEVACPYYGSCDGYEGT